MALSNQSLSYDELVNYKAAVQSDWKVHWFSTNVFQMKRLYFDYIQDQTTVGIFGSSVRQGKTELFQQIINSVGKEI